MFSASPPPTLNASLMARRLGVQVAWLKAEAEAGLVPSLPAGNTFLFVPEAVEKVLAERASNPAQEVVSNG